MIKTTENNSELKQIWINLKHHFNNAMTSLQELSEKWDETIGKGDWFSHEIDNLEKYIKAIEERHNKLFNTL